MARALSEWQSLGLKPTTLNCLLRQNIHSLLNGRRQNT
jgi:hypothetical protein